MVSFIDTQVESWCRCVWLGLKSQEQFRLWGLLQWPRPVGLASPWGERKCSLLVFLKVENGFHWRFFLVCCLNQLCNKNPRSLSATSLLFYNFDNESPYSVESARRKPSPHSEDSIKEHRDFLSLPFGLDLALEKRNQFSLVWNSRVRMASKFLKNFPVSPWHFRESFWSHHF